MPRPRNPPRRDELEEAATDYLLENGIDKLTMRSLAQGVGVSTYAFAYHFKSKEALLTASLQRVERRVSAMLGEWLGAGGVTTGGELIRRYWSWFSTNETARRETQLLLEIWALVLRTPDRFPGLLAGVEPSGQVGFLGRVLESGGLAPDHAEPLATLMVAALTGLQIDFLCSGDADRTGRTVALLARLVDTEAGGG